MEFVVGCSCGLQVVAFPELAGVAQLHIRLLVGRVASSDRPAALQLGIQLRPSRIAVLDSHSQTRKTITPARLP